MYTIELKLTNTETYNVNISLNLTTPTGAQTYTETLIPGLNSIKIEKISCNTTFNVTLVAVAQIKNIILNVKSVIY